MLSICAKTPCEPTTRRVIQPLEHPVLGSEALASGRKHGSGRKKRGRQVMRPHNPVSFKLLDAYGLGENLANYVVLAPALLLSNYSQLIVQIRRHVNGP